jgi:HK97 family phage prohead protease
MEYKKVPYFTKEIDLAKRLVTGIFAVHGNVDDGGDMSEPGSFAKRLGDGGRPRVRFLWNHRSFDPPIASIKSVREVTRAELPDKVLAWAPGATGGVEVTRKYYEGVELAEWVFKGIQEGDITEMSYAYLVHEYTIKADEARKQEVRVLKDVELFDISDVNWGMNPATAGVKNAGMWGEIERIKALMVEMKEGRVLSAANREKVNGAVTAMETAISALSELLSSSEASSGKSGTGETLNERSARLAASLGELVEWVKARKAVREADGRSLSGELRESLETVATEIGDILNQTEPKANSGEALRAFAEFQQIQFNLMRTR